MKIDFDQKVLNESGNPVKLRDDSVDDATLGAFVSAALFAQLEGDQRLDGLAKAKIGELGLRLFKGGEQEITPEEASTIRSRAGSMFSPLFVARIYEMTAG